MFSACIPTTGWCCGSWKQEEARRDEHEQVPSLDADLFDVIAGRPGKRGVLGLDKVPAAAAASIAVPTAAKQQGRVRERHWNCDSDVFAVPEISQPPPAPTFWCF